MDKEIKEVMGTLEDAKKLLKEHKLSLIKDKELISDDWFLKNVAERKAEVGSDKW